MKKFKEQLAESRKLSVTQVDAKLREAKTKYQTLASEVAMGKAKTTSNLKNLRKEIARLSTIKRELSIISEVTNG
ncbi:MAG: 50S ribosomal protein L29 [Patescibacteria group bacterium]